jgi:hypothetical protein
VREITVRNRSAGRRAPTQRIHDPLAASRSSDVSPQIIIFLSSRIPARQGEAVPGRTGPSPAHAWPGGSRPTIDGSRAARVAVLAGVSATEVFDEPERLHLAGGGAQQPCGQAGDRNGQCGRQADDRKVDQR